MLPTFLSVATAIGTAMAGSSFTMVGMNSGWYEQIVRPEWTPPGAFIGVVWTVIYILTAISSIFFFRKEHEKRQRKILAFAYFLNATLNVLWSYIFFVQHWLWLAGVEAFVLGCSVLFIIFLLRKKEKNISYLLYPYAAWVFFATFLTFTIAWMN